MKFYFQSPATEKYQMRKWLTNQLFVWRNNRSKALGKHEESKRRVIATRIIKKPNTKPAAINQMKILKS